MTNALELVPAFRRQVGVYTQGTTTIDSALAGYIADAVQALGPRWGKDYEVEFISPATYIITPDVEPGDIRPILLMASIIYKIGTISTVSFTDGDFSWNTRGNVSQFAQADRDELLLYVPTARLAQATVGSFYGFRSIYNPESYDWAWLVDRIWW